MLTLKHFPEPRLCMQFEIKVCHRGSWLAHAGFFVFSKEGSLSVGPQVGLFSFGLCIFSCLVGEPNNNEQLSQPTWSSGLLQVRHG